MPPLKPKTATQQTYEKAFFLPPDQYPVAIGPLTYGQATSLAQGLNRLNKQWVRENNIPQDEVPLSAKTRQGNPTGTHTITGRKEEFTETSWYVEISPPRKRQKKTPQWLAEVVESLSPPQSTPSLSPADSQEKLLEKFFAGKLE